MLHVLLLARSNRVDLFVDSLPNDDQEKLIRDAMKTRQSNKLQMREHIRQFNEKLLELRLQKQDANRSQDRNRRRTQ